MPSTLTKTTPRRVRRSATLLVLLLVTALTIVAGILYTIQMLAPVSADKNAPTVLVTIPPGKSARQIGDILARQPFDPYPAFVCLCQPDGWPVRAYESGPVRAVPGHAAAPDGRADGGRHDGAGKSWSFPKALPSGRSRTDWRSRNWSTSRQFLMLAQTQGQTFHVGNMDAAR